MEGRRFQERSALCQRKASLSLQCWESLRGIALGNSKSLGSANQGIAEFLGSFGPLPAPTLIPVRMEVARINGARLAPPMVERRTFTRSTLGCFGPDNANPKLVLATPVPLGSFGPLPAPTLIPVRIDVPRITGVNFFRTGFDGGAALPGTLGSLSAKGISESPMLGITSRDRAGELEQSWQRESGHCCGSRKLRPTAGANFDPGSDGGRSNQGGPFCSANGGAEDICPLDARVLRA